MTSKERVLRAVEHKVVDLIPAGLFGTHLDYEQGLATHIGVESVEEMYRKLGVDVWHCRKGLKDTADERVYNGRRVNRWGIPSDLSKEEGFSHRLGAPLLDVTSVDEVEAFPWPKAEDFVDVNDECFKHIEAHQEFAVVGGINSAVFHIYSQVCGFENSLMLLSLKPEIAKAVIRNITDFWEDYLRKVLDAGKGQIDIIENCNDFGTQRSLFISPQQFREFFRPALQRLYNVTKEYGAKVMQHSCGAVAPLIPDFIEMGADILNPIQVEASGMEIAELVQNYGKDICFYGGIDTQQLMPHGPVERIQDSTRDLISLFGYEGGLILSGSQGLLEDIPYDHAVAMLTEKSRKPNGS